MGISAATTITRQEQRPAYPPAAASCHKCGRQIPGPGTCFTDLCGAYFCTAACLDAHANHAPAPFECRVTRAWEDDEYLALAIEHLLADIVTDTLRMRRQGTLWPFELKADDRARQFCAALRSLPADHPLSVLAMQQVRSFVENE